MTRQSTGVGHVRRDSLLDVGGELARPGARVRRGVEPARIAAASEAAFAAQCGAPSEVAHALKAAVPAAYESNVCGRSVRPRVT